MLAFGGPDRKTWMKRLYLQVYLTIVGSLVLVVLTAGVLWHFVAGVPPFGQPFEIAGEIVAELVPGRMRRSRCSSRRSTGWPSGSTRIWRSMAAPTSRWPQPVDRFRRPAAAVVPEAGCERRLGPLFRYLCRTVGGWWHAFRSGSAPARSCSRPFSGRSPSWSRSAPVPSSDGSPDGSSGCSVASNRLEPAICARASRSRAATRSRDWPRASIRPPPASKASSTLTKCCSPMRRMSCGRR